MKSLAWYYYLLTLKAIFCKFKLLHDKDSDYTFIKRYVDISKETCSNLITCNFDYNEYKKRCLHRNNNPSKGDISRLLSGLKIINGNIEKNKYLTRKNDWATVRCTIIVISWLKLFQNETILKYSFLNTWSFADRHFVAAEGSSDAQELLVISVFFVDRCFSAFIFIRVPTVLCILRLSMTGVTDTR